MARARQPLATEPLAPVTVVSSSVRLATQRRWAASSSRGRRMLRRSRLAAACALVPRILAAESSALPREARQARIARVELTSTDMAIVMLAGVDQTPGLAVKLPMSPHAARGLERETAVLAALHADERLSSWRARVPRTWVSGRLEEHSYRVDGALIGRPVRQRSRLSHDGHRMQAQAADTIDFLHHATATTVVGDSALAARWVDTHIDELLRHSPPDGPSLAHGLEPLRQELHAALGGRSFSACWIHGDYWLGNLLFADELPGALGIVDWDAGGPGELPLHDLLHLVLYTRRLATGRELGQIVTAQLRADSWPAHEWRLLARDGAWGQCGALSEREPLSDRHALLLYWLRQVALHARQQMPPAGYRYRLWERRNVHPVLAAL